MNDDRKNLSCEEFQAHLPELIGSGVDVYNHPHLQTCELCRDLLAELETIAAAARELLPVEDPPDRVWEHIRTAIQEEEGDPSPK